MELGGDCLEIDGRIVKVGSFFIKLFLRWFLVFVIVGRKYVIKRVLVWGDIDIC